MHTWHQIALFKVMVNVIFIINVEPITAIFSKFNNQMAYSKNVCINYLIFTNSDFKGKFTNHSYMTSLNNVNQLAEIYLYWKVSDIERYYVAFIF